MLFDIRTNPPREKFFSENNSSTHLVAKYQNLHLELWFANAKKPKEDSKGIKDEKDKKKKSKSNLEKEEDKNEEKEGKSNASSKTIKAQLASIVDKG
jgi:hypothetical protein